MDALLGLQAATGVGVSYRTYGDYVIKAKQSLIKAATGADVTTAPQAFWREVDAAMADYEFANDAWGWKFEGDGVSEFVARDSQCAAIKARYPNFKFIWTPPMVIADMKFPGQWEAHIDTVVQTAWSSAAWHIANAQSYLNQ